MTDFIPDYATNTIRRPVGKVGNVQARIEDGVPLPVKKPRASMGKTLWLPWRLLGIGQSFVYPAKQNLLHTQRCAYFAIRWQHRHRAARFKADTMEENGVMVVRIWRVK